jgi:tRNA(His) 5'-end guanylyltransferase
MSGVTSRSGRVIKKSTKLMDFTSPDDIEAKKAKKMAAASRKLMVGKLEISLNIKMLYDNAIIF